MDRYREGLIQLFNQTGFPEDSFYIRKAFAGRKIIVYGAGECCHWPFMEIVVGIYGFLPALVLDRAFKKGDRYMGIPAASPFDYEPNEDEQRNAVVVICVGRVDCHEEIITLLKGLGFQNIIRLHDVYEIHNPFNQPPELERSGFDFYLNRKNRIVSCMDLFSDEQSREIYFQVIFTHMTRKGAPLPASPGREQYFPKDLPLRRGYSKFICCGADTGSIIRLLNELNGQVMSVACIEPDPWLFAELAKYLSQHGAAVAENIVAFPCAAYSRNAMMPFTSANHDGDREIPTGFGSRILEGGEAFIQTITLDDTLPGFNPTFICMDAEGAELEALKGAKGILLKNSPDPAICIYHSPEHLWEIPLYLNSLGVGYQFYLRNYTSLISETVLYAAT